MTPPFLVTAPASEPITTAQAKTHLRVNNSDDDTLIDLMITRARTAVEEYTRRQLLTATYKVFLDGWPDVIKLPRPPLQSVTHIKYYDASTNTLTTWSSANYQVDIYSYPARIVPVQGVSWPSLYSRLNPIEIQYVCGHANTGADLVPPQATLAMMQLLAHWYEIREATISGTIIADVPMAVQMLMDQIRILELR